MSNDQFCPVCGEITSDGCAELDENGEEVLNYSPCACDRGMMKDPRSTRSHPNMILTPHPGLMVHYVSRGSADGVYPPRHVPFLIVDIHDEETVAGWTFNPNGQRYETIVIQDEDAKAGGTWHWIEE